MMSRWNDTILNILSQFTGGRGPQNPTIVQFGFAIIFWYFLLKFVSTHHSIQPDARSRMLRWGLSLALNRELPLIVMRSLPSFGGDPKKLHAISATQTFAGGCCGCCRLMYLSPVSTTDISLLVALSLLRAVLDLGLLSPLFGWWNFIRENPTSFVG
jgi:hypothetical protein